MTIELSAFFPEPSRVHVAFENLREAGFDMETAAIVTGEDARNSMHKRLAARRRGRAAAGALVAGLLSFILAAVVITPLAVYPWPFMLSFVALAALLGGAIGGLYGMGMEQESILAGVKVPGKRIRESVAIMKLAGGRLIMVRRLPGGARGLVGVR